MKKVILFLLLIQSIGGYSQISLDFQSSLLYMQVIKLTNSETKYFGFDQWYNNQNQFSLYNLDGTLYKTIILPAKPDTSALVNGIWYISKSLFDNDTSTIEYVVEYVYDSIPTSFLSHNIEVIREDGTILLNELTAEYPFVYSTENGAKLMLSYAYATGGNFYQTKVFNLPGKLPNSVNEEMEDNNNYISLYPNPNYGSFFINLHSKEGQVNIIDLYTNSGKLIDTYKSTGTLIQINRYGLSEGLYLLNNRNGKISTTTKMIIKK
jgi:Secretion system C-terminal sorting domain